MNAAQLDENLILRMAGGDKCAFRELYQQTSGAVYGFALSILKNRQDAEDVMHDTYLRTYMASIAYEPKGKPLAWILTIVRNLSYNKLKSDRVNADLDAYTNLLVQEDNAQADDRMVLPKRPASPAFPREPERSMNVMTASSSTKWNSPATALNTTMTSMR